MQSMLTVRTAIGAAAYALAAAAVAQTPGNFAAVTDAMLQQPDPADWLMWRRTLDSWGHSPLGQIDRRNVADLRLVWTRALGPGMQEGTPLVYDGVMYFPNPSDVIQAIVIQPVTYNPCLPKPSAIWAWREMYKR
jgi:alcohol dehydrogenase (cytochrome c)